MDTSNTRRLRELWELQPDVRHTKDGKYNQNARDRIRRFLAKVQDDRGVQILHRIGHKWYYDPQALALTMPDIASDPFSDEIQNLKARIYRLETRISRLEAT